MNLPRCILSPCGTSLLTNCARDLPGSGQVVSTHANVRSREQIPASDLQILDQLLTLATEKLQSNDLNTLRSSSAEINGITRLYPNGQLSGSDQHFLLRSDTWLGGQTARIVAEWLQQQGQIAEIIHIQDLRTDDLVTFQSGMSELVRWCAENMEPMRSSGQRVIFQLSGGFKSIQGFLQTLANFYADEAVYIFESGEDLLRLPRLPIKLDLAEPVRENITVFRRMARHLPVSANDVKDAPEILVTVIEASAGLSAWGELVWDQVGRKELFPQEIWPSPSPKLRYGPRFAESVQDLPSDRMTIINERIDDLAVCLESNLQNNPRRLDFKKLTGNHSPHTHECDAWADKDAKRLFGHYEGEVYILDRLESALH